MPHDREYYFPYEEFPELKDVFTLTENAKNRLLYNIYLRSQLWQEHALEPK